MLKTLSGVNFFLAVEEVLGGSLALGRLLRLFTQMGMDLQARPGSAKKTSLEAKSRRTSSGSSSSSAASASPATSSWGSASDTLDSSGASACRVPATRDEKNEEMLIVTGRVFSSNSGLHLGPSHVVPRPRQSPAVPADSGFLCLSIPEYECILVYDSTAENPSD
jgi:hypothetical protein